jgi:hypothetical protein
MITLNYNIIIGAWCNLISLLKISRVIIGKTSRWRRLRGRINFIKVVNRCIIKDRHFYGTVIVRVMSCPQVIAWRIFPTHLMWLHSNNLFLRLQPKKMKEKKFSSLLMTEITSSNIKTIIKISWLTTLKLVAYFQKNKT